MKARFIVVLAVYGVALLRYDSKVYWICDQSQHVSVARVTEGGAAAVSWQTHADTSPRTVSAEITSSGNLTPANTSFFPFGTARAFKFLFFEKYVNRSAKIMLLRRRKNRTKTRPVLQPSVLHNHGVESSFVQLSRLTMAQS